MKEEQENKKETIHKWTMIDGYTYWTYQSVLCVSCECDPCDCDWGTNETTKESEKKQE